jgi:GT2 family glycosyltransferase
VYVPASEAVHAEASSSGASTRTFFRRYHRNRLRFVVRHVARERGFFAWAASELAWLAALRDRNQLGALAAAYLEVPRFVLERVREQRAQHGPVVS